MPRRFEFGESKLEIYPLEEFLGLPEQSDFLIEGGVLPKQGKLLLFGLPKIGKSILAVHLACCLATGSDWIGFKIPKSVRTLYVQLEQSQQLFLRRFRQILASFQPWIQTDMLQFLNLKKLKMLDNDDFTNLKRALREIRPQVLIIDPFYKIFEGDVASARDVQRVFDREDNLIEEFQLAVINIHHQRKPAIFEGKPIDLAFFEVLGSVQFLNWHDSLIYAKRNSDVMELRFLLRESDSSQFNPIRLKFNKINLTFQVIGKRTNLEEQITKLVEDSGEIGLSNLVNAMVTLTGRDKNWIRQVVNQLVESGRLVKENDVVSVPI